MTDKNAIVMFSNPNHHDEVYKNKKIISPSKIKKSWFTDTFEISPVWLNHEIKEEKQPDPGNLHGYVIPLFQFFQAVGLSPYRIIYNEETQLCEKSSASLLRKIICGILQLLVLTKLFGDLRFIKDDHLAEGKKNFVNKMMIIFFLFYHSSMFKIFWTQMDDVAKVLNKIEHLARDLTPCVEYTILSRNKMIRLHAWSWILSYLAFGIANTIFYGDIEWYNVFEDGIYSILEEGGRYGKNILVNSIFAESSIGLTKVGEVPEYFVYTFGILFIFQSTYVYITWIFNNLILVLWAAEFNELYGVYFRSLLSSTSKHALRDIKVFNLITCILDDFNQIYGCNILLGVLAAICFISNTIWGLFMHGDPQFIPKLLQFLGFCVFLFKLLAASQVNQKASEIVSRIKIHLKNDEAWNDDCARTLEAMMIIFHDLQSHSVGFRGMNFFTLTYSFVGTVFSAIVTYAIIVLQINSDVITEVGNSNGTRSLRSFYL